MKRSRLARFGRGLLLTGLAGVLMVGAPVLAAGSASAHDVLELTNPKDGSTVAVTPAEVTLTFDQVAFAVGSQVLVNGPSGNVAVGPVRIVDRVVHEAIQPGAPAGPYTVEWRVTSADGHPVSGKFTFTSQAVGAGTPSASAPSSSSTPAAVASGGSGSGWVVALALLVVVWFAIIFFFMRRRGGRTLPKTSRADRRRGTPRGPRGPDDELDGL